MGFNSGFKGLKDPVLNVLSLITKAAEEHSEYVILIAIQRQQWLRKRASVSRYTYIDSYTSLINIILRPTKCHLFKIM